MNLNLFLSPEMSYFRGDNEKTTQKFVNIVLTSENNFLFLNADELKVRMKSEKIKIF